MDVRKLKQAGKDFLEIYPGGFANPEMIEIGKKHRIDKMAALAQTSFTRDKFQNAGDIIESMIKIVSRSSMVSLFEKPRFRDFARALDGAGAFRLVAGLEKYLYDDNEEEGFNMIAETLKTGKLAKWSLVSVCPFYFRPTLEVFMKPTTVKNVIQFFNLEGLEYKPSPSYSFYKKYRDAINAMKNEVPESLWPDNGHFSGFLMMAMHNFQK